MIPMAGAGATIHFNRAAFPPKGPEDYVMAGYRAVTPDYLQALGVPLKRGRLIEPRDRAGAPPVVVINESMARQYFPGLDPLGQRMQIGTEPDPDFYTMEVIGIVGDVKQSFEAGSKSEFFVPYAQFPDPVLTGMYLNVALVARTADDPGGDRARRARGAARDRSRPAARQCPDDGNRDGRNGGAAAFADDPADGVCRRGRGARDRRCLRRHGLHRVAARRGDRRAHGDRRVPGNVVGMVVRQGAALAAMGIVIGLAGAAAAARAVQSLLFVEARGFDPLTFAGSAVILAGRRTARQLPARPRAARVSPVIALGR